MIVDARPARKAGRGRGNYDWDVLSLTNSRLPYPRHFSPAR